MITTDKKLDGTDVEHLRWIEQRLIRTHGENPLYDYMWRLKDIIAKLDIHINKDKKKETEMIFLVGVRFESGNRPYYYKSKEKLQIGERIVVEVTNKYHLVTVVSVDHNAPTQSDTKWIVSRVNDIEYQKLKAEEKKNEKRERLERRKERLIKELDILVEELENGF